MKKIFINGRFYSQQITGVQRYSRALVAALDAVIPQSAHDSDFTCLLPKNAYDLPEFNNIKFKTVGNFQGNFWEQLELPVYAKTGILFSPANTGPYYSNQQVVTIHDASIFAYPKAYSQMFRMKYRILFQRFSKKATRIITDSEFSRKALIRYCHFDPASIIIIYPGYEHLLQIKPDDNVLRKLNLANESYFLTVGSLSLHKNFNIILEAMNYLDTTQMKLVVTGGKFERVFNDSKIEFPENIIQTGYINDSELAALYQHAKALIIPSLYEGFGFPVLEGLAFGCPVISSDAASLPEVGGQAVTYFNPNDPEELAEIIRSGVFLFNDLEVQKQLRNFLWESTAKRVLQVLGA